MKGRFAIDTNIAIYVYGADERRDTARALLDRGPMISVQLLNEFVSVARRKFARSWDDIAVATADIRSLAISLRPLDLEVHELAMKIAAEFKLSVYDSLMLAAAQLDECETFYSEDMQHGMILSNQLTIINPFLEPEPK